MQVRSSTKIGGGKCRPLLTNVRGARRHEADAVVALKVQVQGALAAQLLAALGERAVAADAALPRTGLPLIRERELSAAFIRTADERYGTRCSTAVITERAVRQPVTHVPERSFDSSGTVALLRSTSVRPWPPGDGGGDRVEVVEVVDGVDGVDGLPSLDSRRPPAAVESPGRRSRVRSPRGPATTPLS